MDIAVYARVLWRFKIIVALGTLLSLALTVLSIARIDLQHHRLTYRSPEQWISYSRVFVTEKGFPYGAVNPGSADPATLAANAILYAQLATTDPVLRMAFGSHRPVNPIQAAPVLASANTNDALPIVSIAAIGDSPQMATNIAKRETDALIKYVEQKQEQAAISPDNRVVLQVIVQPREASLYKGRSKTIAIVVFMGTMLGVLALAFLLENLRPRPTKHEAVPMPIERRSQVA